MHRCNFSAIATKLKLQSLFLAIYVFIKKIKTIYADSTILKYISKDTHNKKN